MALLESVANFHAVLLREFIPAIEELVVLAVILLLQFQPLFLDVIKNLGSGAAPGSS